jgi:hypothetical protein
MLPFLGHGSNASIVDESRFNRPIDEHEIRERLRSMNERWKYAVEQRELTPVDREDEKELHAELIVSTSEVDEKRASELLYLSEQAILRTLGNLPTLKVETSVVTSQLSTEATLVIYERGVRAAAQAYGLSTVGSDEVEDFVVERASTEYRALLLRFYNTDILQGDHSPMLTVRLDLTGRTLQIQRTERERHLSRLHTT